MQVNESLTDVLADVVTRVGEMEVQLRKQQVRVFIKPPNGWVRYEVVYRNITNSEI